MPGNIGLRRWRLSAVPIAACPGCDSDIHVDEEMDKGDTVVCEDCDVRLQVVGLDPIELDVADDDDDFEEEYNGYKGRYEEENGDYYSGFQMDATSDM
ncbi:MAG: hypothetical protein ACKV2V_02560 [Blastocatellia bacterium]